MSEQAQETLDEINSDIPGDDEQLSEGNEEFEIVAEGEEQPSSNEQVPLHKHLKRVKKLTGRVEVANDEAEELRRQLEAKEEENRLYKEKLLNGDPNRKPQPEDFDTDAEYEAAINKFDEDRLSGLAEKKAREILEQRQSHSAQEAQNQALEKQFISHYERAEALNIPDYETLEDKAIEYMGSDVCKLIMAKSPDSEKLLAHFGLERNEGKAREFRRLLEGDVAAGLLKLGGYATKLKAQPKRSHPPDPDEKLKGGDAAPNDWERRLNKAREKYQSGKGSMSDVLAIKKEARDAGVSLL